MLERHERIYLSICLDVFASAYAPGVSAPQPFGITPIQALPILRRLAESGKVIALDIVELAPNYDPSGITAKLAASLLNEWIRVSNTAT
jgi:formiminoglutamase